MIRVDDIGKLYRRAGRPFWALRHATMRLREGELVTLLGRSGSGKSTLLNIMVGLLAPTEGRVRIAGQAIATLDDRKVSALRNQYIGFVPQGAGVMSTLSVIDNVRLPWFLYNHGPEPAGRAQRLLERVGLGDLAKQYPRALSGGELRRVAIARALMTNPRYIVADEPTSSLDRASGENVVRIFRRLASQGVGVLMVTHDTLSLEVSDRIYDMRQGTLSLRRTK